jgi:hypothetical protein
MCDYIIARNYETLQAGIPVFLLLIRPGLLRRLAEASGPA